VEKPGTIRHQRRRIKQELYKLRTKKFILGICPPYYYQLHVVGDVNLNWPSPKDLAVGFNKSSARHSYISARDDRDWNYRKQVVLSKVQASDFKDQVDDLCCYDKRKVFGPRFNEVSLLAKLSLIPIVCKRCGLSYSECMCFECIEDVPEECCYLDTIIEKGGN
jgi:hypothetical protein